MRITSMASVKLQKLIWILSRSTKRYSTGTGKENENAVISGQTGGYDRAAG